ncbi:MAG: aromatic amino acid lyase, partial [Jatrophihabitantaceae bacterium]
QDIVSMGLIAARNSRRVLSNNNYILAVEFLAAAQAVDLAGRYDGLSPAAKAAHDAVRAMVPTLDRDRYMSDDIEAVAAALDRGEFLTAVTNQGVELH